ncbi:hypothetical protein FA15DRAFT_707068 [Coprinopsis marcescibilis]|uniref:F-box domain-containing protein n=1 Tax=Coprinopsis marcescibilis TaxID=230819 RepID=A0A5C3KN07_COPMA|nr:hypothetical protein FA15DRAFT_707068 [Coprinopsis marcescibilis]
MFAANGVRSPSNVPPLDSYHQYFPLGRYYAKTIQISSHCTLELLDNCGRNSSSFVEQIGRILQSEAHQLKVFKLQESPDSIITHLNRLSLSPAAPNLETLVIKSDNDERTSDAVSPSVPASLLMERAPRLRTLEVTGCQGFWDISNIGVWHELTHLHVSTSFQMNDGKETFLGTMKSMPHLTSLYLDVPLLTHRAAEAPQAAFSPAKLPCLKTVTLHAKIPDCAELLRHLSLPSSATLYMKCPANPNGAGDTTGYAQLQTSLALAWLSGPLSEESQSAIILPEFQSCRLQGGSDHIANTLHPWFTDIDFTKPNTVPVPPFSFEFIPERQMRGYFSTFLSSWLPHSIKSLTTIDIFAPHIGECLAQISGITMLKRIAVSGRDIAHFLFYLTADPALRVKKIAASTAGPTMPVCLPQLEVMQIFRTDFNGGLGPVNFADIRRLLEKRRAVGYPLKRLEFINCKGLPVDEHPKSYFRGVVTIIQRNGRREGLNGSRTGR